MPRVSTLLFLFLASIMLLLPAWYAAGADQKVGFVDIERITRESRYIKSMMSDLEKTLSEKRTAIEQKQDEYGKLADDIERKRSVLGESELDAMRKKSRALRDDIDDSTLQINRMLRSAEKDRMGPALDRVLETIRTVSAEQGYDLVLRGEIVLYSKPAIDITGAVIQRLDQPVPGSHGASPSRPPGADAKPSPPAGDSARSLRKPALSGDE